MEAMGIRGNMGKWISSFLTNRSQSIKIDDHISDSVKIRSGVPQGSVLGPILFLIHISDIGKSAKSNAIIYVDDSKVIKEVKNMDEVSDFQDDMENYYTWAYDNIMMFNESKFVLFDYLFILVCIPSFIIQRILRIHIFSILFLRIFYLVLPNI